MTTDEATRERPVLMNDAMVRAILSGAKRQTRRPVKAPKAWQYVEVDIRDGVPTPVLDREPNVIGGNWSDLMCPFGVPGDRLWVRECWSIAHDHDDSTSFDLAIDDAKRRMPWADVIYRASQQSYHETSLYPWRPSIHMPRWASRLTLRVTDVRVERVRDISEEDAIAEGMIGFPDRVPSHRDSFVNVWDAAYGDGAFSTNPWVWVVSFEVIK